MSILSIYEWLCSRNILEGSFGKLLISGKKNIPQSGQHKEYKLNPSKHYHYYRMCKLMKMNILDKKASRCKIDKLTLINSTL